MLFPHWYTRRVKEAIHIRLHPNNINRDSGIEIPEAWILTIREHNSRPTTKRTCIFHNKMQAFFDSLLCFAKIFRKSFEKPSRNSVELTSLRREQGPKVLASFERQRFKLAWIRLLSRGEGCGEDVGGMAKGTINHQLQKFIPLGLVSWVTVIYFAP